MLVFALSVGVFSPLSPELLGLLRDPKMSDTGPDSFPVRTGGTLAHRYNSPPYPHSRLYLRLAPISAHLRPLLVWL